MCGCSLVVVWQRSRVLGVVRVMHGGVSAWVGGGGYVVHE